MAIRFRCYMFEEGGALKHVPRRVVEGLWADEDALPEYAGTKQRVAEVVVENEKGKPIRILDAQGRYRVFDNEGKLERDESQMWFRLWDVDPKPKGKVVDLRPEIERSKWKARNLWDPTKEDLDRIAGALWPGSVEEAPDVKSVKGKAPKKPPLTQDARTALSEIMSKVSGISHQLEQLSEPGLKGLAYEARRLARAYRDDAPIYEGIAAEADRQREIKGRYRTRRGVWYALVHVVHWNQDHTEGREVDTIEERCEGQEAAIEAARRLLAANAHRFSEDVTVEASIECDLEWTPSDEQDRAS